MTSFDKWDGEYKRLAGDDSTHEIETRKCLFDLGIKLPMNSFIIDAGAHVGDTAIKLATQLKEANRFDIVIIAPDPDASKVDFIKQKSVEMGVGDMIETGGYAIWSHDCKGTLDRSSGLSAVWTIKEKKNGDITLRSIDSLMNGRPLGLLHLDVEGSESYALTGARSTLVKDHPPIIIEHIENESKEWRKDALKSKGILSDLGYKPKGEKMGRDQLYLKTESQTGTKNTSRTTTIVVVVSIVLLVILFFIFQRLNLGR